MITKHFKRPASLLAYMRPVLTSMVALLSILGIIVTPAVVQAGGVPGGNIANPMVRVVDAAKPAVVRIITSISGQLTVHFTATQSANFPQNGGNYKLQYSGSGTFISAHGDILTADHVVKPPHDRSLDDGLYQYAAQDVANYINQNFAANPPYTAYDAYLYMSSGYFRTEKQYNQPSSEVYLSTDFTGPLMATDLKTMPAGTHAVVDRIEKESAVDLHDVAIIHINMDDTPGVQLGDSGNIEQQDELTIIGFPGNGDVSERRDPTQVLTASVNKIYVSALKQTDAGSPVIQVGGNVEHGDSGGPAIDSNGTIVGVVSFGVSNSDTPQGTSFLQVSNSAQTLIQQLNLDTTPGPFEKAWQQAFTDYTTTTPGHWHKAQKELEQLSTKYSLFQAVTPYLNYAQTQASHEKLPQTVPPPAKTDYIWIIILSSIIVLLLIVGIVLFVTTRGRKGQNKQGVTPASTPWSQQNAAYGLPQQDFAAPLPAYPQYQHQNVAARTEVHEHSQQQEWGSPSPYPIKVGVAGHDAEHEEAGPPTAKSEPATLRQVAPPDSDARVQQPADARPIDNNNTQQG